MMDGSAGGAQGTSLGRSAFAEFLGLAAIDPVAALGRREGLTHPAGVGRQVGRLGLRQNLGKNREPRTKNHQD